jgi:hypothetical protein
MKDPFQFGDPAELVVLQVTSGRTLGGGVGRALVTWSFGPKRAVR